MKRISMLALAVLVAACSSAGPSASQDLVASSSAALTDPADAPLDQVYAFGTHNGYWVNRSGAVEAFASGVEERILDQLLFDHVRSIEIDIHRDGTPGRFSVYHTDRTSNSFCADLEDCLRQLEVFHYAVPDHDPVVVILEFKETNTTVGRVFNGSSHKPEDLDATIERVLGDHLYRPRDLLDRCDATEATTLRACVKEAGWPSLNEARGKFLFAVLGNWDHAGAASEGVNGVDWVDYATPTAPGGMRTRAAFPMESPWVTCKLEVPLERRELAMNNSPFLQVQTGGPSLTAGYDPQVNVVHDGKCEGGGPGIFASGSRIFPRIGLDYPSQGIGNGMDTYRMDWQEIAVDHKYPLIQTDHPWYVYDNRGPAYPHRVFGAEGQQAAPVEPGNRVSFVMNGPDGRGSLVLPVPEGVPSRLETLVSVTRPATKGSYPNGRKPRGVGCLVAYGDDRQRDAVRICRSTRDSENARILLEVLADGVLHTEELSTEDRTNGAYGELLRLDVDGACATAYSASHLDGGAPAWTAIGGARCVATTLASRALEAEAGDVLFVGTKRAWPDEGGAWTEAGPDLDAAQSGSYSIVDPADPASIPLFENDYRRIGKEDNYRRGPGETQACAPGQEKDAGGLCYTPCAAGYHGVGPVCWGTCPAGFADDGGTCRRDALVTAKPSYGRGAGVPVSYCPNGQKDGALCYPWCAAGYYGVGPVCWQSCPAGYADDGATCRKDASIISADNSQCPWYDKCGLVSAKGCSKCPAGYNNDGCTCRRDAHIFGKSSYGRGGGSGMSCAPGQQYDAGLCYQACWSGYHGVGPVCWGTCPAGTVDDGGTCRRDAVITAKPSYGRGGGTIPAGCTSDHEYDAGLCYARCPDGYTPRVVECIAHCTTGYVEAGDSCVRP